MKYKVGDRVKIKEDISKHEYFVEVMGRWQGRMMTVFTAGKSNGTAFYGMVEDGDEYDWFEDMIEGPAEPVSPEEEVLQLAIDTYGRDEQIRMLHEEMDELGVALSKYHRNPCSITLEQVRKEIEDVQIMLDQARLMFGKPDTDYRKQKIERLYSRIRDEQEVEVVYGRHKLCGKNYIWVNPDKVSCEVGSIAFAETRHGTKPVIVMDKRTKKFKEVKHHKKIVGGFENESI